MIGMTWFSLSLALLCVCSSASLAMDFPKSYVRIVSGFAAGGSVDLGETIGCRTQPHLETAGHY